MKVIKKHRFCRVNYHLILYVLSVLFFFTFVSGCSVAHRENINPGINKYFDNPDVNKFLKRFESSDRSVYEKRHKIVELLGLTPGSDVADIGAGTGVFSFLMADKVGPDGTVYALDIAKNFVDYIQKKAKEQGEKNIKAIINTHKSTLLEANSVDAVLIVDTYHHFEYPFEMLASIRKALRPDGIFLIVDFERIEGETKEWILNMVRAGKGHFTDEIIDAGFQLLEEVPLTKDHYILRFKKRPMPEDESKR